MKLYSKKHLIIGMVCLVFFLFNLWGAWEERGQSLRTEWLDCILFFILTAIEFRAAFSKKHAAAALIAEQDELEKLQRYQADRAAFWTSVYILLWLGCFWEEISKSQPTLAYGFLAAAGFLLFLRWGILFSYACRLSKER